MQFVKFSKGLGSVDRDRILTGGLLHNLVSLGALSLAFASLAAYVQLSNRTTLVPYVVSVDTQGVVLKGGELDPNVELPEQVLAMAVLGFVEDLRSLSSDRELSELAVRRVFAHLRPGSEPCEEVKRFYRERLDADEHDEWVRFQARNVMRLGDESYEISWTEVHHQQGRKNREENYRARLSFSLSSPSKDARQLKLNPLGLMVESLVISPLLGEEGK
ncbi:MAG: hypothetical protein IJ228_02155 [Succinivibrio sp.]|nr:hypothetical protein [Succinivibrio sp.]